MSIDQFEAVTKDADSTDECVVYTEDWEMTNGVNGRRPSPCYVRTAARISDWGRNEEQGEGGDLPSAGISLEWFCYCRADGLAGVLQMLKFSPHSPAAIWVSYRQLQSCRSVAGELHSSWHGWLLVKTIKARHLIGEILLIFADSCRGQSTDWPPAETFQWLNFEMFWSVYVRLVIIWFSVT